jgi:hypothetical protein
MSGINRGSGNEKLKKKSKRSMYKKMSNNKEGDK